MSVPLQNIGDVPKTSSSGSLYDSRRRPSHQRGCSQIVQFLAGYLVFSNIQCYLGIWKVNPRNTLFRETSERNAAPIKIEKFSSADTYVIVTLFRQYP